MFKKFFLVILLSISVISQIQALEKKQITTDEEWSKKIDTLNWFNFNPSKDLTISIKGSDAKLKIYENESYLLGEDIEQYTWWTWGHGSYSKEAIHVFDQEHRYHYAIDEPENDGFVKIDDWNNVDANELINGLREANKNKGNGLPYARKIEWLNKPTLDRANNLVYYSYKVEWSDGNTSMESLNIILGRKGYITQVFVFSDPSKAQENANFAKSAALDTTFGTGSTYNDYKSGDKVAAVGIGALVATSLGVKALKSAGGAAAAAGGLALFLKKFAWILLAPLAFIGKLFGGGSKTETETSSDEKPVRRRRKKED